MVGTGLWREVCQQADRSGVARRAQGFDLGDVVAVHPNNQVEMIEIGGLELARAQVAQVQSSGAGGTLHGAVGCVTHMPVRGARAVGGVMARAGAENTFGGGRAADIAEADKQDTL